MIEDCMICEEKNLSNGVDGIFNVVNLSCCGATMCVSCAEKILVPENVNFVCSVCNSHMAKNDEEEFERAMKHAMLDKIWACEFVGQCYYNGEGVALSLEKAFEFFKNAAKQGSSKSQLWIGYMYEKGEGVLQSYDEAFNYYTLAANKGLDEAQCSLANCYRSGKGTTKDQVKAIELYLLAAKKDNAEAIYNLGVCFYNGEGVVKNYERSSSFFAMAAEKGHIQAQNSIGYCYYKGEGVKKNFEKAVQFYVLAAEKGHKNSQNNYAKGQTVTQSLVKAIFWLRQSMSDSKDEKLISKSREELDLLLTVASRFCANCTSKESKLSLKCGKCASAFYCNKDCQTNHWNKGGHKEECKRPKE